MKLTNIQMDTYLQALDQIAYKTKGKLAYAIAKNMRVLQNELIEYLKIKDGLIQKYGTVNEDGAYQLQIDSEEFKKFVEEMHQFENIESDVNIMLISPEDIYDSELNAHETMQILFMTNDKEDTVL